MISWKEKLTDRTISTITKGMRVQLNRDSKKVGWTIEVEEEYGRIYTVADIVRDSPHSVQLLWGTHSWSCSPAFLKIHFIRVTS